MAQMPPCERQMRARSRGERSVRLLWRGLFNWLTGLVFQGAFDEDGEPVGEAPAVGCGYLPGSFPGFLLKLEMHVAYGHVINCSEGVRHYGPFIHLLWAFTGVDKAVKVMAGGD